MIARFIDSLLHYYRQERSTTYKLVSLAAGVIFFLVIVPAVFIGLDRLSGDVLPWSLPRGAEIVVAVVSLAFGLFSLSWTTLWQWRMGKGTPAPNAPTQQLVTTGPYRLCRNPIELGAIFYYLGVGTLFGGIGSGLI